MKKFLVIFLVLSFSYFKLAFAFFSNIEQRVSYITEKTKILKECPSRIWPGYDFNNIGVLLVSDEKKLAYNWGEPIDYSFLPLGAYNTWYNQVTWNNAEAIAVSLDVTLDDIYSDIALLLIFHEGFHFFGQKNWPEFENSRGILFPENWTSKYYRLMIYKNLKRYYLDGDRTYLERASYWQKKFSSEFPLLRKEAFPTDLYEGTARYAEYFSYVLSLLGCNASAESFQNFIRQQPGIFFLDLTDLDNINYYIHGADYYEIGAISGFILDQLGVINWKEQLISSSLSVSEYLLGNIETTVDEDDNNLKNIVIKNIENFNQVIKDEIAPITKNIGSYDYVRFILNKRGGWASGAVSLSEMIRPVALPGITIFTGASLHYENDQTGSIINLENGLLFESKNPCNAPDPWIALVPKDKIVMTNSQISYNSIELQFSLSEQNYIRVTDQDNFEWYCVH